MRKNFVKQIQETYKVGSFRFVSVCLFLFRFNRNTKTSCFGLEPKQPKQTFFFGQFRNQFQFHFWLFRIETGFAGHPTPAYWPSGLLACIISRVTATKLYSIYFVKRIESACSLYKVLSNLAVPISAILSVLGILRLILSLDWLMNTS